MYVPSTTAQLLILFAGHETLVFARWNSISKFCLSVSGTPKDAFNSHWKRHAKYRILWRCNGHGRGGSKKETCSVRYADTHDMVVKVLNEEWLGFSMFYCRLYPWKLWDLETNKLRETRNRQKTGSLMITPNYETGVEWRQIASPDSLLGQDPIFFVPGEDADSICVCLYVWQTNINTESKNVVLLLLLRYLKCRASDFNLIRCTNRIIFAANMSY